MSGMPEQVAEKLGFVSGHRFSDAARASTSITPSGLDLEFRVVQQNYLAAKLGSRAPAPEGDSLINVFRYA
jgi:hypothetical protein